MADIVKKLMAASVGHPFAKIPWPHRVLHEAADDIINLCTQNAKLREALEKIANTTVSSWIGDIHGDTQDEWRDRLDDAITIARAALGGE